MISSLISHSSSCGCRCEGVEYEILLRVLVRTLGNHKALSSTINNASSSTFLDLVITCGCGTSTCFIKPNRKLLTVIFHKAKQKTSYSDIS